jgi:hypothetical protein
VLHHKNELGLLVLASEVFGSLEEIVNLEALLGVDPNLMNLFGGSVSHVLNAHASLLGVDKNGAAWSSVQSDREIEFLLDSHLLDYVDAVHFESVSTRLFGDKCISNHLFSNFLNILRGLNQFDSAFKVVFFEVALSTATAENLRLNDKFVLLLHSHLLGNHLGFLGVEGNLAPDNGDSVLVEQISSLVFVELDASLGEIPGNRSGSLLDGVTDLVS